MGAALESEAEKALEPVSPGAVSIFSCPGVAPLPFQVCPGMGARRHEPPRLPGTNVPSGMEGWGLHHKSMSTVEHNYSFLMEATIFV